MASGFGMGIPFLLQRERMLARGRGEAGVGHFGLRQQGRGGAHVVYGYYMIVCRSASFTFGILGKRNNEHGGEVEGGNEWAGGAMNGRIATTGYC